MKGQRVVTVRGVPVTMEATSALVVMRRTSGTPTYGRRHIDMRASIYKSLSKGWRPATIWRSTLETLHRLLRSEEAGLSVGSISKLGITAAQLTWAVALVLWLVASTIRAVSVGEITYQERGGTSWSVKTNPHTTTDVPLPMPPLPPAL